MANGEDDGSKSSSSDPVRGTQRDVARGEAEELGRAQRQLEADKQRLEATRSIAAAEGRVLDALRATIEEQKQSIQFKIDYNDLQDKSIEDARKELAVLEARERVLKQTADSAAKIASAFKLPQSELANFAADLGRATSKMDDPGQGFIKSLENAFEKSAKLSFGLRGTGAALTALGTTGLKVVRDQTKKLVFGLDEATARFTAQTGIIGNLRDQIGALSLENLSLGVSFDNAAAATQALTTGFSEFVALQPGVQSGLTRDAALLEKIGLSSATTAMSLNELNNSLGMTPREAMATTKSLAALGIELGIGADKINQDFVASLPQLRVYGDRAVEVFEELSIAARGAGVSVSTLTGLLGDQFNTFEGSARAAGRLNAVLGTDVFSSTELLMATESERLDILRERLALSGVEFNNLSKFQQLALANAAGINDVNEAAKIFGNTQSEVAMQVGNLTLTQAQLEERVQAGRSVQEKFQFALMSLAVAVEPLVDLLVRFGEGAVAFTEQGGSLGKALLLVGLTVGGLVLSFIAGRKAIDGLLGDDDDGGSGLKGTLSTLKEMPSAIAKGVASKVADIAANKALTASYNALARAARRASVAGRGARGAAVGSVATQVAGDAATRAGARTATRAGARTAGRSLLKKIPGVGLLAGLAFAGQELMEGDLGGAGLEAASGVASLVPVVGTGASLAMDAVNAARDVATPPGSAQEGGITTTEGLLNVHPQEAIVPLDRLMGKFDELINAVQAPTGAAANGGNIVVKVMMNERELGEAVVPIVDRRVLGR